jgi:glycosyltransferase involved in cell wall biosynthesis
VVCNEGNDCGTAVKLIIQIPCYNEEKTLPVVVRDLPRRLPGVDEIEYLVIDDGSSDGTVRVARRLGVHHICSLGRNRGLAAAFLAGMARCLELGADVIVNTDGDNQYRADSIRELIAPIVTGRKDIVVGTRPISEIEHFSSLKKHLQHLGSYVVRRFSGTDVPDATSGFRAYSAEAAMRLHVFNRYTYTLETIIQAGQSKLRIGHVPIQVNPKTRESRLISSIPRYVWRSGAIILRSYITYRPLRTFVGLAIPPALLGMVLCLRFIYHYWLYGGAGHVQSLILAAVSLILSFLMVALGILADLTSTNRCLIQDIIFLQRKALYGSRREHPDRRTVGPSEPVTAQADSGSTL